MQQGWYSGLGDLLGTFSALSPRIPQAPCGVCFRVMLAAMTYRPQDAQRLRFSWGTCGSGVTVDQLLG